MPQQPTTVEVNILDKEYLVACPPEQRDALRESARHLDAKMREIRATGKVFGTERIAVMAALNITHEMLESSTMSDSATELLQEMDQKLDDALGNGKA
ncbi:MAG: cell division protein ZapA [Marinobacter sp.]|uniref:cell division protein ZapA n=1 Tax=Marinobacter sp. TaxID=50741 RepID=UPI00299E1C5D|nr:cell division protein ZapA [Marinobacter sp.]MDX1633329.1 cell division protein ZapA [Marinobacter sp.]